MTRRATLARPRRGGAPRSPRSPPARRRTGARSRSRRSRPFAPQQPKRIALPNGLVIFLQEDHELPLVRGTRAHPRRLARGARGQGRARRASTARSGARAARRRAPATSSTTSSRRAARASRPAAGSTRPSRRWDCLKESFDEVFADLARRCCATPSSARTRSRSRRTSSTPASPAATTTRARSPGARRASSATEPTRPTRAWPSTRRWRPSRATTSLAWHKATVHPNNIDPRRRRRLRLEGHGGDAAQGARRRGRAGRPLPKADAAASASAKPGVYFVQKDDVTQSQDPHGPRRHPPRQPRLLRRRGDERGLRRRLLRAALLEHPLEEGARLLGGRRRRRQLRLPRPVPALDGHEERLDRRRRSTRSTRRSTTC